MDWVIPICCRGRKNGRKIVRRFPLIFRHIVSSIWICGLRIIKAHCCGSGLSTFRYFSALGKTCPTEIPIKLDGSFLLGNHTFGRKGSDIWSHGYQPLATEVAPQNTWGTWTLAPDAVMNWVRRTQALELLQKKETPYL